MSSKTLHNTGKRIREAGTRAVWTQWASLGASALQGREEQAGSIIDPEALLLFSLYLESAERRLRDFAYWWAGVGSELLSVQRTKTLLKSFPPEAEERLGTFARWAVDAGDKRWRRFASDEASPAPEGRKGKGSETPRLGAPSALMLRLRAGFGVSAKADVLAYLLGIGERSASTQETAEATQYSRVTVGGALGDMARAGFIQETTGRPARYFAPAHPWAQLLELNGRGGTSEDAPAWRHWAGVFAFLACADRLAQVTGGESDYLVSSRARDLYERYANALEENRIQVPQPRDYRGAAYLEGFEKALKALSEWVAEHV